MEEIEGEQTHINHNTADSIGENKVEQKQEIDWGEIRQEMRDYIEKAYASKKELRPIYRDYQGNIPDAYCMNNVGGVDNASRWFRVLGEEFKYAIERGVNLTLPPEGWEEGVVKHEVAHIEQATRFGIDPNEVLVGFKVGFGIAGIEESGFGYSVFVSHERILNLTPREQINIALAPEKPCPTSDVPQAIGILINNLSHLAKRPGEFVEAVILLNTKAGLNFSDIARILIESPLITQAFGELTESLDKLSEVLDKLMVKIFDKPAEVLDKLKARVSQSRKPGNKN